jgi:ABC-type branched-subunit amino acid transport system ATPase component
MAETLLEVRDLRKAFGGLKAVDGVTFGVPRGCIKAIIGPNGAGKTTLINLITGLERLNSGEVHFAGQRIDTRQPFEIVRLGIARTFQNLKLFADMSVLENVMAGRHSRTHAGLVAAIVRGGRARSEEEAIESDAARLLDEVGLSQHGHERAGDLPFGKQRLLEIARALATEPSLLLLDEPAAGLNSAEAAGLGSLIRRIRDKGITVLLVEHHMELIMDISDEIFVLNFGQSLAQGTPDEIKNNPAVIAAYLGDESSLAEDFRA